MQTFDLVKKFPADLLHLKLCWLHEVNEVTLSIPYMATGKHMAMTSSSPEEFPEVSVFLRESLVLNIDKLECNIKQDDIVIDYLLETIPNFERQVQLAAEEDYNKQLEK